MTDFFANFLNPEKRLFIGYLISAAFIAIIWLRMVQKKPLTNIVSGFFNSNIWFSKSAMADYKLMIINQFFIKLLAPILIGQLALTLFVFENMHLFFSRPSASLPVWMVMLIFTTTLFILDDFSRYLLHRLMHRIPLLWRFHRAHHSATNLTPLTVLRTHPIEAVLFSLRAVIVHSISLGVCFFFFAESVSLIEIFGSSMFVVIFHSLGSNLRHSHVNLSYWNWLEKILVSPAQHQLHHSIDPKHYDCNFGAILAI
jgi:sterol desaturase/sphingolipid hydroxylase (fatty acid hydroxylase superfamily)